MKIRNVSLVRPDDEGYRDHQGRHAQASMHLRDTLDPGPLSKLAGPIEEVLRAWLEQHLQLTPRRILRYERLTRENDYKTYYKEIDAVEAAPHPGEERPQRFFEIKCTSNAAGALSSARSQLQRARDAVAGRWERVYGHALLVAVAPGVMDFEETPFEDGPLSLDAFDPALPENVAPSEGAAPEPTAETCLAAEDLWRWGRANGHVQEADAHLFEEAQQKAQQTARHRQRRAELKEEGVPREEWPDELTPKRRATPDTEVATFGDAPSADESPLARALREATEGEG